MNPSLSLYGRHRTDLHRKNEGVTLTGNPLIAAVWRSGQPLTFDRAEPACDRASHNPVCPELELCTLISLPQRSCRGCPSLLHPQHSHTCRNDGLVTSHISAFSWHLTHSTNLDSSEIGLIRSLRYHPLTLSRLMDEFLLTNRQKGTPDEPILMRCSRCRRGTLAIRSFMCCGFWRRLCR